MQIKKIEVNKIFTLFLFAHLIIWTLVPSFLNTNLPLDTIEAIAWGYGWPCKVIRTIRSTYEAMVEEQNILDQHCHRRCQPGTPTGLTGATRQPVGTRKSGAEVFHH